MPDEKRKDEKDKEQRTVPPPDVSDVSPADAPVAPKVPGPPIPPLVSQEPVPPPDVSDVSPADAPVAPKVPGPPIPPLVSQEPGPPPEFLSSTTHPTQTWKSFEEVEAAKNAPVSAMADASSLALPETKGNLTPTLELPSSEALISTSPDLPKDAPAQPAGRIDPVVATQPESIPPPEMASLKKPVSAAESITRVADEMNRRDKQEKNADRKQNLLAQSTARAVERRQRIGLPIPKNLAEAYAASHPDIGTSDAADQQTEGIQLPGVGNIGRAGMANPFEAGGQSSNAEMARKLDEILRIVTDLQARDPGSTYQ
jgi:hypothetical protein